MNQKVNISTHFKYIYLLLLLAWCVNQVNQVYRFETLHYGKFISDDAHNLFEAVAEISLAGFSAYILASFNIDNIFLNIFLVIFGIFYIVDGFTSTILLFDKNNKTVGNINKSLFYHEYHFTKIYTLGLLFIIYETIFKI